MCRSILTKIIKCSILLSCLLLLPPLAAFAHSGRTDADGGHYNTSTGEYHFHHGYPAHQHPDGICPYENTQEVNYFNTPSGSDSSETDTRTYSYGYGEGRADGYKNGLDAGYRKAAAEVEEKYHNYLVTGIVANTAIFFATHYSAKRNEKTISQLKQKRKKYEGELKKLQSDAEKLKKYNSEDYQRFLAQVSAGSSKSHGHAETEDASLDFLIPAGCIINADGYPDEEDTPQPQSKFYVFVNPKSGIYHKQTCRYVFSGYRSHILDVPAEFKPCSRCKPDAVDLNWYYEYRALCEINQNCKKN